MGEINQNTNKLPSTPHVIMMGDSRLQMWKINAKTLFAQNTSTKFLLPVKNMAVGGSTSSQTFIKIKHLLWDRHVSHTVLIQTGINDIHWLGGSNKNLQKNTIMQLKNNLSEITKLLKSLNQKVVVMTVFPPNKVPLIRQLFWSPKTLSWIKEVNIHIKTLSDDNVLVWDTSTVLSSNNGYLLPNYIDPDFFLHINQSGYKALHHNMPQQ